MADLIINQDIRIAAEEIELSAVRSQGAGGQNVNKVASAIHLRFDIDKSSLPDDIKRRLRSLADQRITREGQVVIKAQRSRSQGQNRAAALLALQELIRAVLVTRPPRKQTRPGAGAVSRRIERKKLRGRTKALRQKIDL